MSWARSDDRYDDTSKIKKAWRLSGYAVGLHWMSVTSCARHESDGVVDPEWLAERLAVIPAKEAKKAVSLLLSLGLYEQLPAGEQRTVFDRHGTAVVLGPVEEDTYIVHDYLEYQDSAATLEARRGDERLRKAIAAKARESGLSVSDYRKSPAFRVDFPPDSGRKTDGIREASEDPDPTRPDPTRPSPQGREDPPNPPSKLGGSQETEDSPGGKGLAAVPANSRAHGTNPRAAAATQLAAVAESTRAAAAAALAPADDEQIAAWDRVRSRLQEAAPEVTWGLYLEPLRIAGQLDEVLVIDGPEEFWGWVSGERYARMIGRCADADGVRMRLASQEEHDGLRAVAA